MAIADDAQARCAHADAAQAELDRDVGIGRVVHAEHHGQRRHAFAALLPKFAVALLVGQRAAQRGAPADAPGVAPVAGARQAGVVPGGERGGGAELREAVHHGRQRPAEHGVRIEAGTGDERHGQRARPVIGLQVADRRFAGAQRAKKSARSPP
jgi:hypothetical protein